MAKNLVAGFTDYSDQTQDDIQQDLAVLINLVNHTRAVFDPKMAELKAGRCWDRLNHDMKAVLEMVHHFWKTASLDLSTISSGMREHVEAQHVELTRDLGALGHEFFRDLGRCWSDLDRDRSDPCIQKVGELYYVARDMSAKLFDLENLSDHLLQLKDLSANPPQSRRS